jgi:uncharacterized membrane protein
MSANKSANELTKHNIDTITRMEQAFNLHRTLGERVADHFAKFVGSWPFIIGQSIILALWMVFNVVAWVYHWDPYPFILLNLTLSFQAAYAGPIIMMSQNRQARLDERRNKLDLQINLLSEQENTEMLRLLRKICDRLDITHEDEPDLEALEQSTEPASLIEQIEESDKKENDKQKKKR